MEHQQLETPERDQMKKLALAMLFAIASLISCSDGGSGFPSNPGAASKPAQATMPLANEQLQAVAQKALESNAVPTESRAPMNAKVLSVTITEQSIHISVNAVAASSAAFSAMQTRVADSVRDSLGQANQTPVVWLQEGRPFIPNSSAKQLKVITYPCAGTTTPLFPTVKLTEKSFAGNVVVIDPGHGRFQNGSGYDFENSNT
jgi:N-acetylmuramoyl-L-alanine amidase